MIKKHITLAFLSRSLSLSRRLPSLSGVQPGRSGEALLHDGVIQVLSINEKPSPIYNG